MTKKEKDDKDVDTMKNNEEPIKSGNKIFPFIEMLRPGWWLACFFIGLTPGILAIFWKTGSLNDLFGLKTVVWGLGYWASVVGVYVLNDVVGIKEDEVVNPKRPLPSGRISRTVAIVYSLVLIGSGLVMWWLAFSNPLSSLVQLSCIGIMVFYSAIYKDNLLLSLAAALIPVGVWIALAPFTWIPVALFVIVFFWEAALDVPENILHLEGDKRVHPQTYAVRLGPARFAKIGIVFPIITLGGILWLDYLLELSFIYLFFGLIGGFALLYSQASIRNDQSPIKLGRSLGIVMLSMFIMNLGIIAHTIAYSYIFN
jgi:4-hydroxybenzoate polyprenyltransferase